MTGLLCRNLTDGLSRFHRLSGICRLFWFRRLSGVHRLSRFHRLSGFHRLFRFHGRLVFNRGLSAFYNLSFSSFSFSLCIFFFRNLHFNIVSFADFVRQSIRVKKFCDCRAA